MTMTSVDKKELFLELTKHLITAEKPSVYITLLSKDDQYSGYPFEMLWKLKDTEQSKIHHPEGSVWNHTMLVLDEAAKVRSKSKDEKAFMWAALLHDIGKPGTTRVRNGRTTSYDHDKAGEKLCIEFLSFFTEDQAFIKLVSALVRYHMHILYVLKDLPYGDVSGLLRNVDIHEMALLSLCDRMGRTGADITTEETDYRAYLSKLERYRKSRI